MSALYFLILWPITIAIIAPIWGGRDMAHTWAPEAIKLIFGQSQEFSARAFDDYPKEKRD